MDSLLPGNQSSPFRNAWCAGKSCPTVPWFQKLKRYLQAKRRDHGYFSFALFLHTYMSWGLMYKNEHEFYPKIWIWTDQKNLDVQNVANAQIHARFLWTFQSSWNWSHMSASPLLPQNTSICICIWIRINFADWNFIDSAIDLSMKTKNSIDYKMETLRKWSRSSEKYVNVCRQIYLTGFIIIHNYLFIYLFVKELYHCEYVSNTANSYTIWNYWPPLFF